jgi:hypothetical protein
MKHMTIVSHPSMAVVETQIRQAMSRMLVIPCGGSTAGEAQVTESSNLVAG